MEKFSHQCMSYRLLKPFGEETSTVVTKIDQPTAENMISMSFTVPPSPYCLSTFQNLKSKLCSHFRITVRGVITDLEDVEYTMGGNPKRHFHLVDPHGYYLTCCAMQHNVTNCALENMNEVIIYFATGRAPVGSETGSIYLFKDACIIPISSGQLLSTQKTFHLQIGGSNCFALGA